MKRRLPAIRLVCLAAHRSRGIPTSWACWSAILVVVGLTTHSERRLSRQAAAKRAGDPAATSLLGVFALGAAIVIISGGIDLSSGSVIAFSGSICASIMLVLAPVDEAGNAITYDLELGSSRSRSRARCWPGFLIGTLHAWLITVVGSAAVRGHAGYAGRSAQPGACSCRKSPPALTDDRQDDADQHQRSSDFSRLGTDVVDSAVHLSLLSLRGLGADESHGRGPAPVCHGRQRSRGPAERHSHRSAQVAGLLLERDARASIAGVLYIGRSRHAPIRKCRARATSSTPLRRPWSAAAACKAASARSRARCWACSFCGS